MIVQSEPPPTARPAWPYLLVVAAVLGGVFGYLSVSFPEVVEDEDNRLRLAVGILWLALALSALIMRRGAGIRAAVLRYAIAWLFIGLSLVMGYSFRAQFDAMKERLLAELVPHRGMVGSGDALDPGIAGVPQAGPAPAASPLPVTLRPAPRSPAAADANPQAYEAPVAGAAASANAGSGPQVMRGNAPTTVSFRVNQGGQYVVEAQVNGTPIRFIVDTGASEVVLSQADAHRIGINLGSLHYTQRYATANGTAMGAPITLNSVRVGPIALGDVRASVNGAEMKGSLLGMTFLGRLGGYGVKNGVLTLQQ